MNVTLTETIMLTRLRHVMPFLLLMATFFCLSGCEQQPTTPGSQAGTGTVTPAAGQGDEIRVEGRVRLPGQQSSAGIMVFASGTSLITFTNNEGDFSLSALKPDEYEFFAQKPGYRTESLGKIIIESPGVTTLQGIVLQSISQEEEALSAIIGNVELEGVADFSNVIIEIEEELIRTVTDETGVYFIPNLSPGIYRITYKKSGYKPEQLTATVEVGPRPTNVPTVRLTKSTKSPQTRYIAGMVEMYDSDGNPEIKFSTVIVALEGTTYVSVPDGAGKFRFPDLPPADYTITAAAPGFVNKNKIDVDLVTLPYMNVTMVLDEDTSERVRTGSIRGKVVLGDGIENHSGITVGLMGTHYVGLTDDEGNYLIANVPEGTYSLIAELSKYIPVKIEPVYVAPEETTELQEITLEIYIEPPAVLYTQPSDGDDKVTVKKEIPVYIWFSKKMNPGSVKQAISINPTVDYIMYSGKEHPQSDFDILLIMLQGAYTETPASFETTYNVRVDQSATDFEGKSLLEPYEFSFTTGLAEIISTSPGYGEKRVDFGPIQPVLIYFNAPIDYGTLNESTIRLSPETFSRLDIYALDDPDTGWTTARVHAAWEPDTDYTLVVQRGVRTRDGSNISNTPFTLRFHTAERREFEPGPITRE